MHKLTGLMVRHAHGMTEGVVRTTVHHLFIRKGQKGIARTLTDECTESAIFILAHHSPEAEVTRMIGNPVTRCTGIMRQAADIKPCSVQ